MSEFTEAQLTELNSIFTTDSDIEEFEEVEANALLDHETRLETVSNAVGKIAEFKIGLLNGYPVMGIKLKNGKMYKIPMIEIYDEKIFDSIS